MSQRWQQYKVVLHLPQDKIFQLISFKSSAGHIKTLLNLFNIIFKKKQIQKEKDENYATEK